MVEFKRKKGESFESFLRKFNKKLIQSGKLMEARHKQRRNSKLSKNEQRKSALIRMKTRAEKEYLRKIGKLKDEVTTR